MTNATASADPVVVTIQASDLVAPNVGIAVPTGLQPQIFNATILFSEPVQGFDLADVLVSNGTASNLQTTDNETFTVEVTATTSGNVSIDVAAGVATDGVGNPNTAATTATTSADVEVPVVTLSTSSGVVTGPFTLNIDATENIIGLALADVIVTNGTPSNLAGAGDSYTVDVTPVLGQFVEVTVLAGAVSDVAGNPSTAGATFSVQAGSPETEYAANRDTIIDVVQRDAQQRLQNQINANTGMIDRSLDRFIDSLQNKEGAKAEAYSDIPFDVTGSAELSFGSRLSTNGTFFGQTNLGAGMMRTAIGQFDITRDETDSWVAQISGRLTYEWDESDKTRAGYLYGGNLSTGQLSGTYDGDSSSIGVIVGGYLLSRLSDNLFSDVYVGVGYSRTDLKFADTTLSLNGDYGSISYYAGAGLTGSIAFASGIEFRPGLSIDYGMTDIGLVGFQAQAFGLNSLITDDFGSVSVLEFSLTPEIIIPIDMGRSDMRFSFAPSLVCRHTTGRVDDEECGAGIAIGLASTSADGNSHFGFEVDHQYTGMSESTSAEVFFEMQF